MAKRRISNGKAPSGHPLKGKPIASGGPGFIGAKGSSKTLMAGSRSGGKRITKRK